MARESEDLVFAIVSGDRMAQVSLSRVCDAIAIEVGGRSRPEILASYGALPERLAAGDVHVAWAPPLIAQSLAQRSLAAPVCCPRRQGGLGYHSALFSRAGSRTRTIEDFAGARAAWVDPASLSGYVIARRWCERQGCDPDRVFSQQVFKKTHSAVARAVLAGEADLGSTYANVDPKANRIVDAGWSEIGAAEADVHVIATIGPVPADAIMVSSKLSDTAANAVAKALCSLSGSAQAAARVLFRAERFERIPPGYMASLRELSTR